MIRHLTGDPPRLARAATRLLSSAEALFLTDVIAAECVYVLESLYEVPRNRVATFLRAALAMPSISVIDTDLLLRALELYEVARLDFADAYVVACAELSGVGAVASFDRDLARRSSVTVLRP